MRGTLSGNLPLHAYTIPYQFTDAEKTEWLTSEWNNVALQGYLGQPQLRPAGLVVEDGYSQILVWNDPSDVLHVVDVTNMAVAQHVNEAGYESPDSSTVINAIKELIDILGSAAKGVQTTFQWLPLMVAGALALYVLPRR